MALKSNLYQQNWFPWTKIRLLKSI